MDTAKSLSGKNLTQPERPGYIPSPAIDTHTPPRSRHSPSANISPDALSRSVPISNDSLPINQRRVSEGSVRFDEGIDLEVGSPYNKNQRSPRRPSTPRTSSGVEPRQRVIGFDCPS